ncbi:MAG: hypothetical protein ACYCZR_02715 [Burkholderiales bacterium]
MSEEVEAIGTPTEQVEAEQVQEPVEQQEQSEATNDTEAEETPEQKEEKAKREPWFQKRIGELTREKYEAKRAAEQAAQEAQKLREYLESVQQGEAQQPMGDVQSLVKQEAAKLIAEQTFNEACNKVYATGKTEFKDFDDSVANLQMVGMNREFLEIVSSSDAGHKVLHYLGNDLDEAARIAAMPPLQMARELTKLEYKLGQEKPKPVSKAPAPIKPIGTGGATPNGLSDDLPIDEWMARFNKQRQR